MGNISYRGYGVAAALCTALIPAAADAQDTAADRISAIERQIRNLQNELQQLKGELRQSRSEAQRAKEEARQAQRAAEQARQNAARAATAESQATKAAAQAAAVPPPSPPSGIKVEMPGGRPTISTSDGRLSFTIGTQVQFDMGGYFQNINPNTEFKDLNYGANLRRGRLFFAAKYDDFQLNFAPDFGGSPDGSPTIYEANVNYTGFKPVTATIGYFKPWFSLYDSESSNDFLLLERPSIIEIARNLAAGDARASVGAKASTEDYFVSAYFTGTTYGAQNPTLINGEQMGFVGRAAGRPYHDQDWNLHLDFSGENVFHPNFFAGNTPGVNQMTLNLRDRPELRIDMNRLIFTGNLSTNSANAYGSELGVSWRNFLLQGGYYAINLDQVKNTSPAPDLNFNGGYVEAGWVFTGEPIRYNTGAAAFAKPKSAEPWTLAGPGIGAWELSARYSVMNLNSNVTHGIAASTTGGVFGGFQQVTGVALSWYPNDWVRLILQAQYTDVDKLNSAGKLQTGQHFETLAGRVQFAF